MKWKNKKKKKLFLALNPQGLLGKMFMSVLIALYIIEVLVLLAILRSNQLCKHEIVRLASEL